MNIKGIVAAAVVLAVVVSAFGAAATPAVWVAKESINPLDGSTTVELGLRSETRADPSSERVALALECRSGVTRVRLDWDVLLDDLSERVTTREGKGSARAFYWPTTEGRDQSMYPTDHVDFIRRLMLVDTFVAEVVPESGITVTAIFDVRGLKDAIGPLADACGWTP